MNCKLGDMVRFVGKIDERAGEHYGWIGKTIQLAPDDKGPAWIVDPPFGKDRIKGNVVSAANWIGDECLRPIRGGETPEESIEAMKKLHDLEKEKV